MIPGLIQGWNQLLNNVDLEHLCEILYPAWTDETISYPRSIAIGGIWIETLAQEIIGANVEGIGFIITKAEPHNDGFITKAVYFNKEC